MLSIWQMFRIQCILIVPKYTQNIHVCWVEVIYMLSSILHVNFNFLHVLYLFFWSLLLGRIVIKKIIHRGENLMHMDFWPCCTLLCISYLFLRDCVSSLYELHSLSHRMLGYSVQITQFTKGKVKFQSARGRPGLSTSFMMLGSVKPCYPIFLACRILSDWSNEMSSSNLEKQPIILVILFLLWYSFPSRRKYIISQEFQRVF